MNPSILSSTVCNCVLMCSLFLDDTGSVEENIPLKTNSLSAPRHVNGEPAVGDS